ncbi:MAG: MBOAT family protein [Planctomycetes bacterium]|nr:MBOAT family protein [Planctomycetota bacterium]
MLFNSFEFLVFYALVFAVYWRLPHRGQNLLLMTASLFFYGVWNSKILLVLVAAASIDYVCGIWIEDARSERVRRRILIGSIVCSLAVLCFFKYANFFLDNLVETLRLFGLEATRPALRIILPVGISFHTFQAMSYAVDVYRREQKACRNYLDYLLYISFFPQLVAGPIERGARLMPQVESPRARLNLPAKLEGVKLLVVGYLQKVAIADVLAPKADLVFADPSSHSGLTLLLGLYAFAIQIYCDFAGYSNIARGTARLLGFQLMRNFAQPYLASNITEFWRRWHISLSTWLRDYLYIPLGGNRRGQGRTYANLMLTMLLGGLWHGANWTFVVWGGLHGAYLALHKALFGGEGSGGRVRRFLGALVTFHLVCLAWIFFRAESFADAWSYLVGFARPGAALTWDELEILPYVGFAFGLDFLLRRRDGKRLSMLLSRGWVLETVFAAALVVFTVLVGENHVLPFVYFQF